MAPNAVLRTCTRKPPLPTGASQNYSIHQEGLAPAFKDPRKLFTNLETKLTSSVPASRCTERKRADDYLIPLSSEEGCCLLSKRLERVLVRVAGKKPL